MSIQDELLADIDRYLAERGISETTFGRKAVNDWSFVGRLRGGGGVTVRTVERVRRFLATDEKAAS